MNRQRRRHSAIFGACLSLIVIAAGLLTPGSVRAAEVRASENGGRARLFFDWQSPVRYAAEIVNGNLIVQFDRPVTGDATSAAALLPSYVDGVAVSASGRRLTFPLKRALDLRTFTVGNAVVVDLDDPQGAPATTAQTQAPAPAAQQAAAPSPQPTAPAAAPTVPVRTGSHETYERVVFDWPAAPPYTVTERGGEAVFRFNRSARIDAAALQAALPDALSNVRVATAADSTTVTFPLPEGTRLRHFVTGNRVVADFLRETGTPAPTSPTPASPAPVATASAPTAPTPQAPSAPRPAAKPAPNAAPESPASATAAAPVAATATAAAAPEGPPPGTVASLPFGWSEPAAAAAFQRAGYTWIVFDRYQSVDLDAMMRSGKGVVHKMEQLTMRDATVLRMIVEPGYNPSVRRDGLLWVLDLTQRPLEPSRHLQAITQMESSSGPRLFVPVSQAGEAVIIEDPEVGDTIIAVPIIPLGYGIYPQRTFVDGTLLATAQGIAVVPKSDNMRARSSRNGVAISVDGGMRLTPTQQTVQTFLPGADDSSIKKILDLATWNVNKGEDYFVVRNRLEMGIVDALERDRNDARMRFARYLFVNGFEAEALGVLDLMADHAPPIIEQPSYRALRGAASLMMGRYQDAVNDFSHSSLRNEDDASFWLAASKARLGDTSPEVATKLSELASVLQGYPDHTRVELALIGADTTITAGDDFAAQTFLDVVRQSRYTHQDAAALAYESGRLAALLGELDSAITQWDRAIDSRSRYYRALATLAKLELLYDAGRMEVDEFIDKLERLRFVWRGDDFELKLLNRLADLYIDKDEYGKALRTLQLAVAYFRDYDGVDRIANRMADIFEQLFLGGKADNLSPVTAIALFDEFRELMPAGTKGDEMIRLLADRLVSVDLLDQASMLLERQVEYRLDGRDLARVGTRLALLHLMNRLPEKALDVLDRTEISGMPFELRTQRRHLRARALTDLNRPDEAITLLGADMSDDSKRLRAEIYWRTQNWPQAAASLEAMLPEVGRGDQLSDENAHRVLDLATALTLARDERGVSRIRRNYLAAMQGSAFYNAFDLITSGPERGLIDYRTVSDRVQQAENFRTFLSDYEAQVERDGLSAIN